MTLGRLENVHSTRATPISPSGEENLTGFVGKTKEISPHAEGNTFSAISVPLSSRTIPNTHPTGALTGQTGLSCLMPRFTFGFHKKPISSGIHRPGQEEGTGRRDKRRGRAHPGLRCPRRRRLQRAHSPKSIPPGSCSLINSAFSAEPERIYYSSESSQQKGRWIHGGRAQGCSSFCLVPSHAASPEGVGCLI